VTAGLPTSALADEILLEGAGRVRALISFGGNPLVAWPDQLKTHEALKAFDLLTTIDIKMSATAKMADYVIAPKLSLETDAVTLPNERVWGYGAATTGFPVPYAMFAPAVVDPPDGADLIEEWEFFYGPAQRMGLQLSLEGADVNMDRLTTDDVHQLICRTARIPLDEVKRYVSRRMLDVYNSSGHDIPRLVRKYTYNPAFMNPADMHDEGFQQGDVIEIDSGHGQILGIVAPEEDVIRGVISMAHAWGDAPKYDSDVRTLGSNTGRLSRVEQHYDRVHGMPIMSAIPVNVRLSDDSAVLTASPGPSKRSNR
jgi:anaerobic selenocysteine-containing dehydrogenase